MKQAMQLTTSAALFAAALTLAGCATEVQQPPAALAATAPVAMQVIQPAPAPAPVAVVAPGAKEFYIILPENGRIYAFGDTKNYFDFLSHAEIALTRTQIGAGPGGKTVVYGITNDDVKQNKPSLAEQIFQKKLAPAADFHGEVHKNGRFYVFNDLDDMQAFAAFGEVPYSYTDIAAGPSGETLVWVMNKKSYEKGRPLATIERFKQIRTAKG